MKYLYILYLLYHYGYIYTYIHNGIYYFKLGKKILENRKVDDDWVVL